MENKKTKDELIDEIRKGRNKERQKLCINLIIGGSFIIILSILLMVFFDIIENKPVDDDVFVSEFGLTESEQTCLIENFQFYGINTCSHCNDFKKYLGDDITDGTYIDCSKNREVCGDLEIMGYPTGIAKNIVTRLETRHMGVVDIDILMNATGCNLEEVTIIEE